MSFLNERISIGRVLSFDDACEKYPHRYTFSNIPDWAYNKNLDDCYYAPEFSSDIEWYMNTIFPGEKHISIESITCESTPKYPIGELLPEPFHQENINIIVAIELDTEDKFKIRTNGYLSMEDLFLIQGKLANNGLDMSHIAKKNELIADILEINEIDPTSVKGRITLDFTYPEVQMPIISIKDILETTKNIKKDVSLTL